MAEEASVWDIHRNRQRTRMNYTEHEGATSFKDPGPSSLEDEFVTYQVSQLTMSPENTLFHYLHFDHGEAVFIAPLKNKDSTSQTPSLHEELLDNFRAACQLIHSTFQSANEAREAVARQALQSSDGASYSNWMSKSGLAAVREQGMLFQWSPAPPESAAAAASSKRLPLLSYWVCGRVFPDGRECYVCYHDSAPQNVAELAFRLAYGVCL